MNRERFEYDANPHELGQVVLGHYYFYAKGQLYEFGNKHPHDFGETLGRTANEARDKMLERIKTWIKEQGI